MSASPVNESQSALVDATTYGGLGALAIFARWLLSPDRPGWLRFLVGAMAASIVSIFAGFALDSFIESVRLKYALVGCASYFHEKLLGYVKTYVDKVGRRLVG